jgi:hypothetical protein
VPFVQPWFEVDFGRRFGGLGTVGYRLYKEDGTDSVARTTVGVIDISGNGAYGVADVTVPDDAIGIEWDTGVAPIRYAVEDVDPYRDRDAIPTVTEIATGVWSEPLPGTYNIGAAGEILGNLELELTLQHGAGSWQSATVVPSAVAFAVWSEPLPGAYNIGEAGRIVGVNLDTNVGSRAAPGDQMDLVNDAVDANSLANSAVQEIDTELTLNHGAGSWQSATVSPSAVAFAVWSEPLPGAYNIGEAGRIVGTNVDATISSRATQADILSDATPFAGADIGTIRSNQETVFGYGDGIWFDSIAGAVGVAWPLGTSTNPVSDEASLWTLLTNTGLRKIYLMQGSLTLNVANNYDQYHFVGLNPAIMVGINGAQCDFARFEGLSLWGACNNDSIVCYNCILWNLSDYDGFFYDCVMAVTQQPGPNGDTYYIRCIWGVDDLDVINIAGRNVYVWNCRGNLDIHTLTNGAVWVQGLEGTVEILGDCTGGIVLLEGVGQKIDNSGPGCTVQDSLINQGQWIAANTLVAAGGSNIEVRTGLTQANNFFDGMYILVINSAGSATRKIEEYENVNGACFVDEPFPFTPAAGDQAYILDKHNGSYGKAG